MTREEAIIHIGTFRAITKDITKYKGKAIDKALNMAIKALEQEPKIEKVIKMRDATPEEQKSVDDYIKSISKPTGVDFWELEQEPCEDAISRQAAIEAVMNLCKHYTPIKSVNHPHMDFVIEALQELPPVNPQPCEDAISRQAAVDFLENHAETYEDVRVKMGFKVSASLINNRNNLSPVTPQPKVGHWYVNEWGNITCSGCGCTALYDKVYPGESVFGKAIRVKTTFCPICGAKMVEPQKSEEQE